jgi:Uma2 family endonuclease
VVILIMSNPDRTPQEDLRCKYASWQIEQMELLYPEFRLELVNGQFLVGGTIAGSRWLLKAALMGWGLESAIGFAPLVDWWRALQVAYAVDCQTSEEWLIWAESLPLPDDQNQWWLPLGSRYGGEHHWVRDRLRQVLGAAVSQSTMGKCFGPRYGMWVGVHVLTPDIFMLTDVQLAENPCYDRFVRGAATLVVEIVLPEWTEVDEDVRSQHYHQHQVFHYWTVNPLTHQVRFWQWSVDGYEEQFLDADGSYRGLVGLTFTPELLWLIPNQVRPATNSALRMNGY